jgi:hypothetical protein
MKVKYGQEVDVLSIQFMGENGVKNRFVLMRDNSSYRDKSQAQ